MARKVKKPDGRTRISSKHQITIPKQAFAAAGLAAGDTVRVEVTGPGLEELLDRYDGALTGGEDLAAVVARLRDEWA